MLSRYHYGVDACGTAVFVIFDSNLALGVGTQVCHVDALAAYLGQAHEQGVAEGQRQRYVEGCLVGGVAEHHALVAGALVLQVGALNAAVYILALFVHGQQHAAAVAVEAQLRAVVAYFVDDAAGGLLHVDIGVALYFAGHHYLAGGDEGLAGHFRLRVAGEKFIEDGVGNLVGDLVGMAFRY